MKTVPTFNPVGMINVADSMAVIKKLVFEEKKVTKKELKEALDSIGRVTGIRKSEKCA